ncbi:MAG TPA: peptidyl-prolyl cis-trans isomerase [Chthonomonadaceae bacterium]|nr:peptidyl-prolyl cis-trans isomerase [Chthonomonadaceae bacterium]
MEPTSPIGFIAEEAKAAEKAALKARQSQRQRWRAVGVGLLLALAGYGVGAFITHRRDQASAVIVTVNGTPITQEAFFHRLEIAAGTSVMSQMVAEELKLQFAQKMGVFPTEAEVEARYAEGSKKPDFAENLKKSHQTLEDVKHSLRVYLAEQNVLAKGVTVNDDDIRAFYTAQSDRRNPNARYYRPEAVQIAAIVTATEAEARKALSELARSVPFAQVARAYSKDRSAANGGLLPPVLRGRVDPKKFPGLEQRLFQMKVGEQIDLVKIAGAYWIIRCVGKQAEATVPFEQVKEECRTGALLSKGMAANGKTVQEQYAAFQKEADIKALWPQYQEAVEKK